MAYDEALAVRVRAEVDGEPGYAEKRMFGGLAFSIDGNLAVSASSQGGLLLRVDPAEADELIRDRRAERFVMRGREMRGWLHIDADAKTPTKELRRWIAIGVAYARSLPAK